ncbi:MAG TPA: hypothetical protein PLQ49_08050 [Methanothrix sp.]|nr:hypothetical protein [Methanothrix sp.]
MKGIKSRSSLKPEDPSPDLDDLSVGRCVEHSRNSCSEQEAYEINFASILASTLAPGDGRFTNTVEVDPRSVDGPIVQPVYASCVIDVGVVEGECDAASCGIWQPPNWDFEHYGYEPDELTCEDLTCTGCGES